MLKKLITIGKIISSHGIKGEVCVLLLTDFPRRFEDLKSVMLDNERLFINNVRYYKQFVLLKFINLDNINSIKPLLGKSVCITREELIILPKDHYYQFDIIGLKVYSHLNKYIGIIVNILRTVSNDVYVIEQEDNKPSLLVPALKKVVKIIDIPNGKIIVDLLEEW